MQQKYDEVLKILRSEYGNNEKYSEELIDIGKYLFGAKFNGVYPWDLWTEKNGYSIINTDDSSKGGTHWIAIYKKGKNIYVYDSFGRQTKNVLKQFYKNMISKGYKLIDSKHDAEQREYQSDCGLRSIAWLLVAHTHGIKSALTI